MTAQPDPACFGHIFPDVNNLRVNEPCKGVVFHLEYESLGIGTSARHSGADMQAFKKCLACPEYRACYDLSLGKFLVSSTIHTIA